MDPEAVGPARGWLAAAGGTGLVVVVVASRVLSGSSAPRSAVWAQRDFGNERLWNGAIDDAGASLGLPADQVADEPAEQGTVRFETIRRFKGLERPVIILVELSSNDAKMLDKLLYVGGSRARQHLVVIGSGEVLARLR